MKGDDLEAIVYGHESRNAELVTQLKSRGVDVQGPRSIEHHFWSKNQRDGALLAHELYKRGFLVLVLAPAAPRDGSEYTWNVEAGSKIRSNERQAAKSRDSSSRWPSRSTAGMTGGARPFSKRLRCRSLTI